MARLTQQVLTDRAARDTARAIFDNRLAAVKTDLAARSVGGRVVDKVADEALAMVEEARDVANENRAIVWGTLIALLLWFLRNPLIEGLEKGFGALLEFLEEKDLLP